MQLRAKGWGIPAAAREAGVSRTSGTNWERGYKIYRDGEVVGYVAPLDHLAVREVSARHLSQNERFEIADLRRTGASIRAIAAQLGRAPSTVVGSNPTRPAYAGQRLAAWSGLTIPAPAV
jgi:IS30 family transposase